MIGNDGEEITDGEEKTLGVASCAEPLDRQPAEYSLPESNDSNEESEEEEEEEDIPLSEIDSISSSQKEDLVRHQRLTINNTTALFKAYKSIAFPSTLPFSATQTIISTTKISIPDVNDDLNRELAFYKQCLDAATEARLLLKNEGVPFTRPVDYFAEMVKSDEHMGKIKSKMFEEAASKKASAEARKQRDLKKFGKQVQIAKLQERDKAKRATMEKINLLKRSMFLFLVFLVPGYY
jgi:rRNA-processing protein EBP2